MTWMSQNQWIWLENIHVVVCAFLPFAEKKHHEESKNDKFKLLASQSVYTPKPHPLLMLCDKKILLIFKVNVHT
jgi:hypothetical protein